MGERFFGSIHIIDLFIEVYGDGELIKSPEDWFASFLRKHIEKLPSIGVERSDGRLHLRCPVFQQIEQLKLCTFGELLFSQVIQQEDVAAFASADGFFGSVAFGNSVVPLIGSELGKLRC